MWVCSFYIKNKVKSEIFNDKKSFTKMFFSAIAKNLDWGILTKNLVTFKRWDGFKEKNFSIMGLTKKSDFQGGSQKTNILEELPKKGGLDSLQA